MSKQTTEIRPANRNVFIEHAYPEQSVDLGEVTMNYVVSGAPSNPALLLIPGQTESWWGFEKAIPLLDKVFQVYAIDLRGQGRTSWTPRRYTIDNMGNDLVRFIALIIKRPVIVSGCSSGGVLSAWLSAFAIPGQVRGAHYEDPPLFASESNPLYGHSIRQAAGPFWELIAKYLGDQWSVGAWDELVAALRAWRPELPPFDKLLQTFKEYDPEWARAFHEGTIACSCPHELILSRVKVPILFTHHARLVDPKSGCLIGAISDMQADKVREILKAAGQPVEYISLPDAAHVMHQADPQRFAAVLTSWAKCLP